MEELSQLHKLLTAQSTAITALSTAVLLLWNELKKAKTDLKDAREEHIKDLRKP